MGALELMLGASLVGALTCYLLTGGADFGAGIWSFFALGRKGQKERALIDQAIGPIWEANHVWLIIAVTILFTAFPAAFALITTALHIPLTLMLLGIVLRGTAFAVRTHDITSSTDGSSTTARDMALSVRSIQRHHTGVAGHQPRGSGFRPADGGLLAGLLHATVRCSVVGTVSLERGIADHRTRRIFGGRLSSRRGSGTRTPQAIRTPGKPVWSYGPAGRRHGPLACPGRSAGNLCRPAAYPTWSAGHHHDHCLPPRGALRTVEVPRSHSQMVCGRRSGGNVLGLGLVPVSIPGGTPSHHRPCGPPADAASLVRKPGGGIHRAVPVALLSLSDLQRSCASRRMTPIVC